MTTPTPLTGIEAMTVMYQEEYELRVQKEKELAAALDLQAAYFARCEQLCDALAAAQERAEWFKGQVEMFQALATEGQQAIVERAQAAEARAESYRKDAERYRYIKDDRRGKFVEALALRDAENWDAAIDAAIAEGEKP